MIVCSHFTSAVLHRLLWHFRDGQTCFLY